MLNRTSGLFVCAGMRRSASTWSYHVLRKLLDALHYEYEDWGFVTWQKFDDLLQQKRKPFALLKSHIYLPKYVYVETGEMYPLYTHRNLCEVVSSMLRMQKVMRLNYEIMHDLEVIVENGTAWESLPNTLSLSYKAITTETYSAVGMILAWLGVERFPHYTFEQIVHECTRENLRQLQPETGYDKKQLLWHEHISDAPYATDEKLCQQIQARYRHWLTTH